jgi:hypothetical protein
MACQACLRSPSGFGSSVRRESAHRAANRLPAHIEGLRHGRAEQDDRRPGCPITHTRQENLVKLLIYKLVSRAGLEPYRLFSPRKLLISRTLKTRKRGKFPPLLQSYYNWCRGFLRDPRPGQSGDSHAAASPDSSARYTKRTSQEVFAGRSPLVRLRGWLLAQRPIQ